MASQLQALILGSAGVDLTYTVKENGAALDISAATGLTFNLITPKKELIIKTAVFDDDGTDGILKYAFVAADLPRHRKDLVGLWLVEPHFTLSSFVGPCDPAQFLVLDCVRRS